MMIPVPDAGLHGHGACAADGVCRVGASLFITCDYTDPVADMPNYQATVCAPNGVIPLDGVVVASSEGKRHVLQQYPHRPDPYMQSTHGHGRSGGGQVGHYCC